MKINNEEYNQISPTAIMTSYPRIFSDIPYEKEIYEWLNKNNNMSIPLNKRLAPEIEARYKLINKILDETKIKQVLELASGYSSRGINYSKLGYNYVELDLDSICKNKSIIIKEFKDEINLNLVSGNALNKEDVDKCQKYFNSKEELVVINEGLLRYLTFEEIKIVAQNIYDLLHKFGGFWITSDLTPKAILNSQNQSMPNFNLELSKMTPRNNINNRFANINEVRKFFDELGFEILEIHPFVEMKESLNSINKYKIYDDKIKMTLEDAIVTVLKIKE